MNDGLFWYPGIEYKFICDGKIDKRARLDSYVRYFLARLQCMFKYEGLPDTIPAKWFEHYLLTNGNAVIGRADDGELYAFFGGHGGKPDAYYISTQYIVANPYLNFTHTYTIGGKDEHDAVIIYNDTYSQGVLPLLERYCSQLVENDITLSIADILARATLNISAADDKTKASAELYLKRLRDGDLAVIAEQAFIEGLNLREFRAAADSLTNLIEYHQYIKASLFNELGLNSNYNMKRESINSNESQLNDDMLHPLIDNMLKERREGIERVNYMFGTNITVEFDSAWLENEKEEQAIMTTVEGEADTIAEASEEVSEETPEEAPEETTEEDTSEVEELTEAVEELTQSIEVVAEVIEDNIEGVNGDDLT